MGLTRKSVGTNLLNNLTEYRKNNNNKIIALVGNPNVGKSSLFNQITGMKQHTGNWPGKTVMSAVGSCRIDKKEYIFVDLPGCYSLKSNSPEEEIARDFITSDLADITVIVCDATSLERNLNLTLQITEITDNIILCVNLMDEARKKHIDIDLKALSDELGIKVIGCVAHKKSSVKKVLDTISNYSIDNICNNSPCIVKYPDYIEEIISHLSEEYNDTPKKNRLSAIKSLEKTNLIICEKTPTEIKNDISYTISYTAEKIAEKCVKNNIDYTSTKEYKIDKFLTGKFWGFLSMFCLLVLVFWLTISVSNYPSSFLSDLFLSFEKPLYDFLIRSKIPIALCDMTVYGVYHILTWIISVMLPPMAIFFPLFTLLEDIGYLPRIAFNLDKCFKKCSACGKQALTMCMGFGCNAAGVVGCRIIDSPRERLLAIITNSFIPCNGRFPALIAVITMFFVGKNKSFFSNAYSALILTAFIILTIIASLLVSRLLSKMLLKGVPSSFTLELPPYRKPQISKLIIRSVFDRTLFVLGRAVVVAAPAGLFIWLISNIEINSISILSHIALFLEPFANLMGLDGIILTAFIIGFPANEIVLPLIVMMYMSSGTLSETGDLYSLKELLISNGWTYITALNTIIFMLMHWPCSTTCLTIKSETKSIKWTMISIIIPTICGILMCILINGLYKIISCVF